jgi:hypothetical protein
MQIRIEWSLMEFIIPSLQLSKEGPADGAGRITNYPGIVKSSGFLHLEAPDAQSARDHFYDANFEKGMRIKAFAV